MELFDLAMGKGERWEDGDSIFPGQAAEKSVRGGKTSAVGSSGGEWKKVDRHSMQQEREVET